MQLKVLLNSQKVRNLLHSQSIRLRYAHQNQWTRKSRHSEAFQMTIQSKNLVMVSRYRRCYTIKRCKMVRARQIITIRQVAKLLNGASSWTTWSRILTKCSIKAIPIRKSPQWRKDSVNSGLVRSRWKMTKSMWGPFRRCFMPKLRLPRITLMRSMSHESQIMTFSKSLKSKNT